MKATLTSSSGNIFADLGIEAGESINLRVRSELMIELKRRILERGVTQQATAEWLNTTQPRISDLLRGKISEFSTDMLIELLGRAGFDVSLDVSPRKAFECRTVAIEVPYSFEEVSPSWRAQPLTPIEWTGSVARWLPVSEAA